MPDAGVAMDAAVTPADFLNAFQYTGAALFVFFVSHATPGFVSATEHRLGRDSCSDRWRRL